MRKGGKEGWRRLEQNGEIRQKERRHVGGGKRQEGARGRIKGEGRGRKEARCRMNGGGKMQIGCKRQDEWRTEEAQGPRGRIK